jgi:hypothetical protein
MEGGETWLSSQATDFFDTGTQNLFPDIRASIPTVTTLRSSLSMCVFSVFVDIFSHCFLLTAYRMLLSE